MLQISKNDTKALKDFAITMAWAFPAVFTGLLPWLFNYALPIWPFIITGLFLLLYVSAPRLIFYPYKIWAILGGAIGWLNTRIILGICFYLLIMPIGSILKTFGKLQYKTKTKHNTNYVKSNESLVKQDLENPF